MQRETTEQFITRHLPLWRRLRRTMPASTAARICIGVDSGQITVKEIDSRLEIQFPDGNILQEPRIQ